ncbi:hypothetical protein ABB37_00306 [Leptomonas pyrrhocoris]|uniref:Uncharacterized protein n=1 Tax=Leptomonas pyrrhocoris TaxID=157538 RepID=A0A0M9GA79_LEPPY|nr:hypothetical protein ABB37_00306 [Leptomonas pyrrhocoris]XP_015664472.1 hypothetical protein ABB37_00306 [Leptomonas pyrrhocoris]KPA86032.1 hypothetical protein ABB37_00306 [Leptomonas pyrrhocoris]KPA86033.1 hypothetical protein ABB37_00306 [Leptomonas pyrrhocoris]|eukprot:XP_015664471.1 hypothetical protein ABB37_00306 [Leptomonas pyrrhocoris]
MLTHSPMSTAKELADQFAKQGMRCTEGDSSPQLWCSYCTAYLSEKAAISKDQEDCAQERNASPQNTAQSPRSQPRATEPTAPSSSSHVVSVRATKEAILAHCATRTHLHLYEHHTQEDLRHWCPVELHGYRMLLNHHCVYPARMFGDGRLLMDFTIAGGMLLGQDVCGGVKLWPQHRYAAVELVLPSSRSGVREVWVPLPEREEIEAKIKPPSLKRPKGEGRSMQLLHEGSEIPAAVAWTYNNEDQVDEKAPFLFRKDHAMMLQFVPRYFDEDHGLRSRRVIEGTLAAVLDATNASIIAEARLHEQRRRYSITHNLVKSANHCESGAKRGCSDISEGL